MYVQHNNILIPAHVKGVNRDLVERIAELEQLDADDRGWQRLGGNEFEFDRRFLTDITRLARIMFLKNPLIKRGVTVKADYVYARGVTVTAPDDLIREIITAFLDDPHNQNEFTGHQARIANEISLQTDGNLFIAMVPNPITGHVRVSMIDPDQITDVLCDPNNRSKRMYYRREWLETTTNFDTGAITSVQRTAYYRDYRYTDTDQRDRIGSHAIIDNVYIYHVRVGGLQHWKFGLSEYYAAIAWAKAYNRFLENWSTLVEAYARFAFAVTTEGGKQGVAAAKERIASTINAANTNERNPAPAAGSVFVGAQGTKLDPIRTAGATTSAEDGRRLLLMVASVFGLPETFFGDVSVGTLATARSLDRPTELMLTNRQNTWADILHDVLTFVLERAALAIKGPLYALATLITNEYNEQIIQFSDGVDTTINVVFPPILEQNTTEYINAIVQGATLDGKSATAIPDMRVVSRMILTALGAHDVDNLVTTMFDQLDQEQLDEPNDDQADDPAVEAMRGLREALTKLLDYHQTDDSIIMPTMYAKRTTS